MPLSSLSFEGVVRAALIEDIGTGDITTSSTVSSKVHGKAVLLAKSPLVLCGLDIAASAFHLVDNDVTFTTTLADGEHLAGNREIIAQISGRASSILTAERVALNFLQRMTGIATISSLFVDAVAGTKARVVDTRKTTPGLRTLEKYAVRTGGAFNHRFGLSDGVLIKDNHIVASGGIAKALGRAREVAPHTLKIEVEVKSLAQIREALDAGADVILLDNMSIDDLKSAVTTIGSSALTEASGGVNLSTIREIAETGVDLISVGALTHSAPAADISLDFLSVETA